MNKKLILPFGILLFLAAISYGATTYINLVTGTSVQAVSSVSFDFAGKPAAIAAGSDIWPTTWASDNNQYFGWGDGGGFWGDNTKGAVSLGFGYISSLPPTFTATNQWGYAGAVSGCTGAGSHCAVYDSQFCGKTVSLISVGGKLYGWNASFYNGPSKVYDSGTACPSNPATPLMFFISSTDLSHTWTQSSWSFTQSGSNLVPVDFLNFDKDNADAYDAYTYVYATRVDDNTKLYLVRILSSDLPSVVGAGATSVYNPTYASQTKWFWFTGFDGGGNPMWSNSSTGAVPVYTDTNVEVGAHLNVQVFWNNGSSVKRFMAVESYGLNNGQFALLTSATPWGPFETADYETDWGGLGSDGDGNLGFFVPTKWISADGLNFWIVYTTNDSFNAVKATLTMGSKPTLSAVNADLITSSGATIDFISSVPCVGTVDYGTDTNYSETPVSDSGGTSHAISLSALSPQTTYYYKVTCSSANPAYGSFQTVAAPEANVATYLMDTSPGQTVDGSGKGNTLTISGAASNDVVGRVCTGQGLFFSSNNVAYAAHSASLDNLAKFTYCAVILPTISQTGKRIISKETTTGNNGFHIDYMNGYIQATVYNSNSGFTTKTALNSFPVNERHQFCVQFDSTSATDHQIHIYEDGSTEVSSYQAQPDFSGTLLSDANALQIGNNAVNNATFVGIIDSVYIDNYEVDGTTLAARAVCDTPPNITCGVNNNCYYISPSGNDSNDGTSPSTPWKTFAKAFPAGCAQTGDCPLKPGDGLNLMDGTYSRAANTGLPDIDCSSTGNAVIGTSSNHITVQSVNERLGYLHADGTYAALRVRSCRYWDFKGLRWDTVDLDKAHTAGGAAGAQYCTVQIENSLYIDIYKGLGQYSNRYFNVANLCTTNSSNNIITIRDTEIYSNHRHGIEFYHTTGSYMTEDYVNSRNRGDLKCDGNTIGGCSSAGHCNDSWNTPDANRAAAGTGPCCSTVQSQSAASAGQCPKTYSNNTWETCRSGSTCGYWSIVQGNGDEGLIAYSSNGDTVESSISEGSFQISLGRNGLGLPRHEMLGSISLNQSSGLDNFTSCAYTGCTDTDNISDGIIYENDVSIGGSIASSLGVMANGVKNAVFRNITTTTAATGFSASNAQGNRNPSTPNFTVTNMLSFGHSGAEYAVNNTVYTQANAILSYSATGGGTTSGNFTVSNLNTSPVTLMGIGTDKCIVYVPGGSDGCAGWTNPQINSTDSNMKGAGTNAGRGTDIGANIVHPYLNRVLDCTRKVWTAGTGVFIGCGAQITGVNDDATFPTSACVNVNKRLGIGVAGQCPIP